MSKASTSNDLSDSCVICSSKHERIRPSLCQCKHCSRSLCFDCMKDHHDELQLSIVQVSNRYNELKQLIDTKLILITKETVASKKELSEWYTTLIDRLTMEKVSIDLNIENAEQKAKKFVYEIESEMQIFQDDIQTFTKNNTFRSEHLTKIFEQLDELIQRLDSLSPAKEYDLPLKMPKYELRFDLLLKSTTNDTEQTRNISQEKYNIEDFQLENSISDGEIYQNENINFSCPDESHFRNRDKFESTTFSVNCMESDGINILYSTIEDPQQEYIAYCYLEETSTNYAQFDPSQVWNHSRIVDIIWWNSIKRFICATKNGIYTIEYLDQSFKILNVIGNLRIRVCVAANTDHLWIHGKDKIYVYDINFELVKSINFKMSQSLKSPSFCLTDNLVAFTLIRRVQNNRYVSHIEFYDFNMKRIKRVRLESSETVSMIRTDGNDRFYVAVGQQRFYIIAPNGTKQTINLGKQASCLAVINSHNIVLTKNSRSDLELVRF